MVRTSGTPQEETPTTCVTCGAVLPIEKASRQQDWSDGARHHPRLNIVIISSRSGEEETAAIKASGCNGLLYKPVRREVLICTVEDQLNEPRRRCQRIRVSVPCSAKGPHGNLVGTIESISTLGMLLVMDQALLPGEILNFEFALPDNATPLNLSGNVVWVGRCTKGSNMRAGVEFINPKVNERERLYDFVKWHNHPAAFRNDPRPGMEDEAPP